MKSAELWNCDNLSTLQRLPRKRTLLTEAQVGSRFMAVAEIIRQRSLEMASQPAVDRIPREAGISATRLHLMTPPEVMPYAFVDIIVDRLICPCRSGNMRTN